jgi:hypothetical protein
VGSHPNHDTLITFRQRFIGELEEQAIKLVQEMKLVKLGTAMILPRYPLYFSQPNALTTSSCTSLDKSLVAATFCNAARICFFSAGWYFFQ